MTLDRMLYIVISAHKDGPYVSETDVSRMDLVNVTKDIVAGQYGTVLHVLEINPVEHICNEVTHDFREIIEKPADRL
jgi:hypothetical protein